MLQSWMILLFSRFCAYISHQKLGYVIHPFSEHETHVCDDAGLQHARFYQDLHFDRQWGALNGGSIPSTSYMVPPPPQRTLETEISNC